MLSLNMHFGECAPSPFLVTREHNEMGIRHPASTFLIQPRFVPSSLNSTLGTSAITEGTPIVHPCATGMCFEATSAKLRRKKSSLKGPRPEPLRHRRNNEPM